jgi:hypothetical protein
MEGLLKPLNLYDLSSDSTISKELRGYNAGFRLIEDILDEIGRESFVQTAVGSGLKNLEEIFFKKENSSSDIPTRRELLRGISNVSMKDFTKKGIENSLAAIGVVGTVTEIKNEERITMDIDEYKSDFSDFERLRIETDRMLPAHLDCIIDIGDVTFAALDAKDYTWDEYDSIDFTWNKFELDGMSL